MLVLCFDPLTEAMPGPAIRAWHLALELAADHEVVLAGTAGATRTHPAMRVEAVDGPALEELVGWADAVFAPTSVVSRHPVVVESGKPLAIDMYIPTHLENLEAYGASGDDEHFRAVAHQVQVINGDLGHGDFFLCASDRQRDFWLGSLASLGRVNPSTYGDDPTLRRLIDVVPFGMDPSPAPEATGVLRRAFPAIGAGDPVVIWGGGVYNWFDPLSLLRGVDTLRGRRPGLRLVFLGMRHPNPGIPEMRMAAALRTESDRLGLTGTHVFFNEGWVPYDRRGEWLADADVAASTHLAHIETHFSFRTRVLDYLWAGRPMVLTGGDTLSDQIAAAGFGVAVAPGDAGAIAEAIDRLLDDPPDPAGIRRFAEGYAWAAVAEPLRCFAAEPRRAPDRPALDRPALDRPGGGAAPAAPGAPSPPVTPGPPRLRAMVGRRLPPPVRERLVEVRRRIRGQ